MKLRQNGRKNSHKEKKIFQRKERGQTGKSAAGFWQADAIELKEK